VERHHGCPIGNPASYAAAVPSTSFRPRGPETDPGQRPLAASFTAVFGALLTAEVLLFGALMVLADPRLDRGTVVIAVLVLAGAASSLMVFQGRRGGWILLVLAAIGALAAVLMFALVLSALGLPDQMWIAVLLAVVPLGCLVLAPQRPVRQWAGLGPTRRPAGGRRGPARSH
jgi:peptidoglycan/LPS O-acetylase OafA/YrhL